MVFATRTRIEIESVDAVIDEVCRHMTEHNAELEMDGGVRILRFNGSSARFTPDGEAAVIDVHADHLEGIYFTRMAVVSHIREFSRGDVPAVVWAGDGNDLVRPPNFQILEVVSMLDITPHMRRLTLTGMDVARFLPLDTLHLNILVQRPNIDEPQWPTVGADGLIDWPNPDLRPDFRKYTVRSVDVAAGTLAIDFVRHADAGPGSDFAEKAKPGDRIGIAGPGGGGLVEADWYLFAGDETALPAIARMLEALPATASGRAYIEVADKLEIQPLSYVADVKLTWLLRNGRPAGTTDLLVQAVTKVELPDAAFRKWVWVGCEYEAFRLIRSHLRGSSALAKKEQLVVAYWRGGAEMA